MDRKQADPLWPPNPYSSPLPTASGSEPQGPQLHPTFRTNPWIVFLLPLVVFTAVGSFEPASPADAANNSSTWINLGIEYRHYPLIYSIKILLTIAAILYVLPGYRQVLCQSETQGSFSEGNLPGQKINNSHHIQRSILLAVAIGGLGVVVWISLAFIQREALQRLGWSLEVGARSAFNPLKELASTPAWAYIFLAIRFVGLVLVVPVVEEMFLRGFLMRFFVAPDWWRVPIGVVNKAAIVAATLVPVLMHPREALAATVWFSAITWLSIRTRGIWPCIVAHATTNLLLGGYVVIRGQWWLM